MQRLDRYILSQFLTLFGFFALVLVSVYWVNQAVRLFERLLSDGQTALVVLEFTALALPQVISIVLPVAAFAATAYGTNRLANELELVAMQAGGASPWRLARPVLIFGIFVAVMMAILVHGLVPSARARLADRQAAISEDIAAQFLRAGSFQYPADDITLFIREIATDGRLLDLFVQDDRDPNEQITYTAAEALLVRTDTGPVMIMSNGMSQNLHDEGGVRLLSVTRFDEFTYDIGGMISASSGRGRDLRDYFTPELLSPGPALLEATGKTADQARLEAHERIAKPLLAPVAAMLGFAMLLLGGYSRFGVWRQVLWAIIALIFVQFLNNGAANMAGRNPSQWWLLYLPALIGALMCCLILWLAAKPRRLRHHCGAAS